MPIQIKAKDAGIFDASEVAMLGRVFDKLKSERPSPGEHEAIAAQIIAIYSNGVSDEAELFSLSKQALSR